MNKRIIAILLSITLLLGFCGCELTDTFPEVQIGITPITEETPVRVTTLDEFSIIYFTDQNLHPLMDPSIANQKLNTVLYLPAVTYNEKLEMIYGCASSVTSSNGNIVITPDTSRKFSDGTALTAEAIASCFRFVLNNADSPYHRQLMDVENVGISDGVVILKLKNSNPGAMYCLDIPIVKESGEEGNKKYYGCGDYIISSHNNEPALKANPYAKSKPSIAPIYLLNPSDKTALSAMFSSGVLDVMSSDLLGDTTLSVSRDYESITYLSNTMLFVGINHEKELFSAELRQAISTMIPRNDIVKSVLMGNGTPTALPFYPAWSALPSEALTDATKDELIPLFEKAGMKLDNGELFTKEGKHLSFSILVCESNKTHLATAEKIKTAGAALGIEITLDAIEEETFLNKLENGNFDLYLARFDMNKNLNPTELYSPGSTYNYGSILSAGLTAAYQKFTAGESDITPYLEQFRETAPFFPIAFIQHTMYYTKGITIGGGISNGNPLGNLSSWKAE